MSRFLNSKLTFSLILVFSIICIETTLQSGEPEIRIGILNLQVTSNLVKRLSNKFKKSENFEDFFINPIDVDDKKEQNEVEVKKRIIKKYLEKPNNLKQIVTSYLKQFTSYENVVLIPIDIDLPSRKLDYLVENLDAVFLTGGPNNLYQDHKIKIDEIDTNGVDHRYSMRLPSLYLSAVKRIVMKVSQLNERGRDMVIWGTCLGFEALIEHESTMKFKFDKFEDIKKAHAIKIVNKIQPQCPDNKGGYLEYEGPQKSYVDGRRRVEMTREVSEQTITKDQNQNDVVTLKTQKDKIVIADSKLSVDNLSDYLYEESDQNSIEGLTELEEYPDDFNLFINSQFQNNQDDKSFYFYHYYGVTPKNLLSDEGLKNSYDIITISDQDDFTNVSPDVVSNTDSINLSLFDESPTTFVSSIQHKRFPFYGVQFHPEKMEFETNKRNPGLIHTDLAIKQNRKLMNFFIYRVRRSKLRNLKKGISFQDISSEYLAKMKFKVKDLNGYDEIIFF
jgi:GMP synthase-like glutamine amidotransferase